MTGTHNADGADTGTKALSTARRLSKRPEVVPYVAAREGEYGEREAMLGIRIARTGNPAGLRYLNEEPRDRYRGMLWARRSQNPGHDRMPTGRPQFAMVHPSRQRESMDTMLCQVCIAARASHSAQGWLFVLPTAPDLPDSWPEGELTQHPPLCLRCARLAVKLCPALAEGHLTVRVRRPRLWGGVGALYRTGDGWRPELAAEGDIPVAFQDKAAPWLLASQLVRRLCACTPIDLKTEPDPGAVP
ncbi:hypothetical protein [Streptomyces sp. ODS28]|uniref:hypothetical protein n=1 Tax=Streptomyces sp. ODS28 TaxID=3136688 RepID=UPI0031E86991